jgi:deazaflavin-dependent oxidoreductase (nitroreductase family)
MEDELMASYREPSWLVVRVFNPIMSFLVGSLGLDLGGRRVLEVRGRRSGEWRSVPVNLLVLEDERYLVSPRGETQWVRNLRATPEGRLRVGRRVETFTATEVPDDEKPPVLRAYLERWSRETRGLFAVGPDASDEQLRRIAPDHPVFRVEIQQRHP